MFTKELFDLPFGNNDTAYIAFPNITSGEVFYGQDDVFIATLRALLCNRMKPEETLSLVGRSRTIERSSVDFSTVFSTRIESNTVYFYEVLCRSATKKDCVDALTKWASDKSLEEITDLRMFMSNQGEVCFFIDREKRSTIIISFEGRSSRICHLIPSLTSRFLPWYFESNPLTEDEKNLVKSLTERNEAHFLDLMAKEEAKIDFRSIKITHMLKGFESSARKADLSAAKTELANLTDYIQNNIRQYQDFMHQRESLNIRIAGIEAQISGSSESSELLEFVKNHKMLEIIKVEDQKLTFVVNTYLEYFDADAFERLSENYEGYIYSDSAYTTNVEFENVHTREKILNAIFGSNPELKLKICSNYTIDLRGYVGCSSYYSYPECSRHYLRNPHIDEYSCLGDHKVFIEDALRAGNLIGAITQCIASAQSVNICESASFPYLLQQIFDGDTTRECIELPDGTSCSVSEAFNWLTENS